MFTRAVKRRSSGRLDAAAWLLVLGALLAMAAAAALVRFELVHFRAGLKLFLNSGWACLAGAVLAAAGAVTSRRPELWLAVLLGAGGAWLPYSWLKTARSFPPIHDVATDPAAPPSFEATAVAPHGGPEVAAQQRKAYPDLAPLHSSAAPEGMFGRAEAAARALGWEIVFADGKKGRLEAVARTPWFGFKDDVVVLVRPQGRSGSRVDVRSVSRVGRGDAGVNARRIRDFLALLPKETPGRQ